MRAMRMLALFLGLVAILASSPAGPARADDVLGMYEPTLTLPLGAYRAFGYDLGGGVRFEIESVKIDGEKRPAIEMSSRQDNAFGFFNVGLRMGLQWDVSATYTFPKDKGLRAGSSFAAMEVDYPYTRIGDVPPAFLVAGVTYQSDGLSTFANRNGSTVGGQRSYVGAKSVDLRIHYAPGVEYEVCSRATGTATWDTLYAGDPGEVLARPIGLGFGMSNVDNKARIYVSHILAVGELFQDERAAVLADVQQVIDLEMQALAEEDLAMKFDLIDEATLLLSEITADTGLAYEDGIIDIDIDRLEKLARKILKLDQKVLDKLDPDRNLLVFGSKERKRLEEALKLKQKYAEVIQGASPGF